MGELENLRAANIAYSQQVNELIGRLGNAEANAARLREGIDKALLEIEDEGPKALKYAAQELNAAIAGSKEPRP